MVFLICFLFSFNCKEKIETNRIESAGKYSHPSFISIKIDNINLLKIGDTLNLAELPESRNAIVTGSGGLINYYLTKIANIEFDLGINNQGIVQYIGTNDENFITQENLKIGDSYSKIKSINSSEPLYEPGFAFFVKLNSGWKASLKVENFDEEFDKSDLNREIVFFFRK